jgi:hypothetical protein
MKGGDDFSFAGHSRLGDRYTISDGLARWNTSGNHGVLMTWKENWTDGNTVEMSARLKVNGKFECDGMAAAEVKKGCREDILPVDGHERLQLKYYLNDADAAWEDMIPFPELCKKYSGEELDNMLRQIFMAWPTVDSLDDIINLTKEGEGDKKPKKLKRHGHHIKTWPLAKDAFTTVVGGCGEHCALIAKALANEIVTNTEGTDACIVWPDVQEAFKRAGHGAGDISRDHMCHHKVRLTLKIPPQLIKPILEAEWRMYCKGDGQTNHKPAFSYGMYITDVEEVSGAASKGGAALPAHAKKFSFQGHSRVEGRWVIENGTAVWNEQHTGRVKLDYVEAWPGAKGVAPTRDELKAHLKVNLKFECESTQGFIQKARREDTLPLDAEERMKNKYYIGDRDAAYEIDPNNICRFDEWIVEIGAAGAQEFLTHLFFQWPTLPKEAEEVKRYGHDRKTWPIGTQEAIAAITAEGKYEEKVASGVLQAMYDKNHIECEAGERITWPDFQQLFEQDLGAAAKDVFMLEKDAKGRWATNLTLKIPFDQISACMCGEYRMYCMNIAQNNSFSYGVIIDSVTETGSEDNGFGTKKHTFTFTGRPRLEGKYALENGTATWNEQGSGRLQLWYDEKWPDGMVDKLQARLKVNGKFACDSDKGFVQKARKEDTLPVSSHERMKSKYYIGDQDAAHD